MSFDIFRIFTLNYHVKYKLIRYKTTLVFNKDVLEEINKFRIKK